MASMIAASLIGGLGNIRGSFFGGMVVRILEIGRTIFLAGNVEVWYGEFQHIFPRALIALAAYFYPNGLKGKLE